MSTDCIFCQIIAGHLPAGIVYQDADTLSFVDPRQSNVGHLLVVPKVHAAQIWSLPAASAPALMHTLVKISQLVQQHFQPDGLSIWQSNGPGAHQEVPHIHFHVFPRYQGDKHLNIYPKSPQKFTIDQRRELAESLKNTLAEIA